MKMYDYSRTISLLAAGALLLSRPITTTKLDNIASEPDKFHFTLRCLPNMSFCFEIGILTSFTREEFKKAVNFKQAYPD